MSSFGPKLSCSTIIPGNGPLPRGRPYIPSSPSIATRLTVREKLHVAGVQGVPALVAPAALVHAAGRVVLADEAAVEGGGARLAGTARRVGRHGVGEVRAPVGGMDRARLEHDAQRVDPCAVLREIQAPRRHARIAAPCTASGA